MKVITIVGARPQFVKAAAVSRAFASHPEIEERIVHTGQHFDENMSEIFFREMDIPDPHYRLAINNLSHGAMTGRMIEGIEKILQDEYPDMVLVYGDTNSTLAGALAAKKLHFKVAHVEAGLRSFNMRMPEEINRILTDRISDVLFCPTETAIKNLQQEGFQHFPCRIEQVGDVMQDAVLHYLPKSQKESQIIEKLGLADKPFLLITIHRAENTDDPTRLGNIVDALNTLSETYAIVFPLHPRTRKKIADLGLTLNFETIEPVGYLDMIQLLYHCRLVMTDSGGLQKEAYFFNKYCITLREETEWVELIEHGFNRLAPLSGQELLENVAELAQLPFDNQLELYGGGKASQRIAELLLRMG